METFLKCPSAFGMHSWCCYLHAFVPDFVWCLYLYLNLYLYFYGMYSFWNAHLPLECIPGAATSPICMSATGLVSICTSRWIQICKFALSDGFRWIWIWITALKHSWHSAELREKDFGGRTYLHPTWSSRIAQQKVFSLLVLASILLDSFSVDFFGGVVGDDE